MLIALVHMKEVTYLLLVLNTLITPFSRSLLNRPVPPLVTVGLKSGG